MVTLSLHKGKESIFLALIFLVVRLLDMEDT